MGELKPGWTRVKFGEIAECVTDRVDDPKTAAVEYYVGLEHLDADSFRIRRWGRPDDVESTKLRFKPGDIIFGKRRAYQRKLGVADFEGICSAHAMVLRAKRSAVHTAFLPFFMQSDIFMERAIAISVGSLSPTINWRTLAEQEFALPPFDAQERIAATLRAATNSVEALLALKNAALAAHASARESLIEWTSYPSVPVGALCEMQNGRPFPSSEYRSNGVRLLRPANLAASGILDWRTERTVFVPDSYCVAASSFVVRPGDVVINLTAQSLEDGFMGRVCFARDGDESLLNQRIGRFVKFTADLLPEYLFRVLQGTRFQAHAIAMCEGTKVKHMFWRHIEDFRFPLPPVDQQRTSCEALLATEQAEREVSTRLCGAQHLVRLLLDRAVNGRPE